MTSSPCGGIIWSGSGSSELVLRSASDVGRVLKVEICRKLPATPSGYASEVIIRDLARVDAYPEVDDRPWGISPWFKVEGRDLYHRGLEVFLSVENLREFEREDAQS